MRLSIIIFICITVLLASCAQQVVPNGGIKDEKPPKILSYNPDNKSIKFTSDNIIIKFDEYISIKDPSQIIISPFLENKPLIDANGKQINISFLKSKPEQNLTYTINFANSITDVNEGNMINNFSYVFSTGNFIDSNYVTGNIINAETSKEETDVLVALYPHNKFTDTTVFKLYPAYFTKTKENGRFTIENLPQDSFILLAYKDANGDNKYQETEQLAFTNTIIKPSIGLDSLRLILFQNPLYTSNKLLDTVAKYKHTYQFVVYKPTNIKIKPTKTQKYYSNIRKGKLSIDTIQLFLPNSNDSILEEFKITTPDTSYHISLKTKLKSKYLTQLINIEVPENLLDTIKIKSTIPIDSIPLTNISFLLDTLPIKPSYYNQISNFEWHLFHPYIENKGYSIALKDSAFIDVFNRFNLKNSNSFTSKSAKDYGTLLLNLKGNIFNNSILQLIAVDENNETIIKEWKYNIPNETIIDNLKPGRYQLKMIIDTNKNGIWDTGNYAKKEQAERIYYDKTIITIKAYWDIEQSINLENIIKY
jgi:uncharacterized protein (DUF2141 family)